MSPICIVEQNGLQTQLPADLGPWKKVETKSEWELQKFVRDHPELFPLKEFGMEDSLLVVGMEIGLGSGPMDMVGLTRSGDILLIEFKTGLVISDFRKAIAQLLDYGSALFRASLQSFETRVVRKYFNGRYCRPTRYRNTPSLKVAFDRTWGQINQFETFTNRVIDALASGSFHFVVVAQRFTPAMQHTVDYLNSLESNARFYLVEMTRHEGKDVTAYQARTIGRPQILSKAFFLDRVDDHNSEYSEFFKEAEHLGLIFGWGKNGVAIRVRDFPKPLAVAWAYPPEVSTSLGRPGFTFGYRSSHVKNERLLRHLVQDYVKDVAHLAGTSAVNKNGITGCTFEAHDFGAVKSQIYERLAELVSRARDVI